MADEKARKRKETEDEEPDVLGHTLTEEPGEDDPERKRKRKKADEPGGDDPDRKR